jgi:hypothetical protein
MTFQCGSKIMVFLMEGYKMRIYNHEWLSLSKEIKLKLIRLAILENEIKYPKQLIITGKQGT